MSIKQIKVHWESAQSESTTKASPWASFSPLGENTRGGFQDETGYSYFGARYYWPEVSVWLSVDPLSDKYPSMSAYMYCAGNPVILVDQDGRDWYEFENDNGTKTAIWQKGNSKSIELDGQKYRNIGSSYSHQIDNGDYINYYQNFAVSIGDKENGMSAVLRNPKAFNYLISSTSPISNDGKSMLFIASMHKAQNRFLRGSAELMANTLNGVGAAAQTTGTGLLAIPGGQAVGAGLIGLGNVASGLGTAISMGINAADGEWGQVAFDLGSLTLSRGLGYGINGLNTTPLQSQFLDGIASSNISIFSGVLNWGMNKKKK